MIETSERVLAIHAHPDDESLWTGGALARFAKQGSDVRVITCTDGFRADGTSHAEQGRRVRELHAAATILGITAEVLDHRDGPGIGGLCAAPFDDVVISLATRIRDFRPELVITYDAHGTSGHHDHIRVHRATLAAVEAAAHPLVSMPGNAWAVPALWQVTLPNADRIDLRLDVSDLLEVKWAALSEHVSEFERGAHIAALRDYPESRPHALGTEHYVLRKGPGAK